MISDPNIPLVSSDPFRKNPYVGRERQDLTPVGIRSWRVQGFPRWLIIYRVIDERKVIFYRVRSGTMNLVVMKMDP